MEDGFLSVATSSFVEAFGAAGATSAAAEVARARVEMSCMVAVCCWCLRGRDGQSWGHCGPVVASRRSCRGEVKFAVAAVERGARDALVRRHGIVQCARATAYCAGTRTALARIDAMLARL